MMGDRRIRTIVDYPNASEVFPDVTIWGGVSHFHWHSDYDGPCRFIGKKDGEVVDDAKRFLDQHPTVVRHSIASTILTLVGPTSKESSLANYVLPPLAFNFRTPARGQAGPEGLDNPVYLYHTNGGSWIERETVTRNTEIIDQWKVLASRAHGRPVNEQQWLSDLIIAPPGAVCTETYVILGVFTTPKAANQFCSFMQTKLVRFMISLLRSGQTAVNSQYAYVPYGAWAHWQEWTDDAMYDHFDLLEYQIDLIESTVTKTPRVIGAPALLYYEGEL